MFVRCKRNKSGSTSVLIVSKSRGKYELIRTIGCAHSKEEEDNLVQEAYALLPQLMHQRVLDFSYDEDRQFLINLKQGVKQLLLAGPELIPGKLFDEIGYNAIPEVLFRYLVITRIIYPGSKLKAIEYLLLYRGISISSSSIYRYLDKFNTEYSKLVKDITFRHTKKILNDQITVAFYDITTLYFETSEEDELRKLGFSKDGKAQNPQILLSLLVGINGYPLAYEVFEGNKFEGHTLIPVIEAFKTQYALSNLIVVADAGLLSKDNIESLREARYPFILGARLKNETENLQQQILSHTYRNGQCINFLRRDGTKLIVSYSAQRAKKDEHMRKRGMERLEKSIQAGKLTKEHINNRGYNKYLAIKEEITVSINYELYMQDSKWNGLKGYITNCDLSNENIINSYAELWNIEKAFRISKTDLEIRPIYHRLERRIKTHICIAFCAYKVYKELERQLQSKKAKLSVEQAISLCKTIYEAEVRLPQSLKKVRVLLPLGKKQQYLLSLFNQ